MKNEFPAEDKDGGLSLILGESMSFLFIQIIYPPSPSSQIQTNQNVNIHKRNKKQDNKE